MERGDIGLGKAGKFLHDQGRRTAVVDFLMTTGDIVLHAYSSTTPSFEPVKVLPEPYSGNF